MVQVFHEVGIESPYCSMNSLFRQIRLSIVHPPVKIVPTFLEEPIQNIQEQKVGYKLTIIDSRKNETW